MSDLSITTKNTTDQQPGWTNERAEGYAEGNRYREQGLALSEYHKVGIDEYALGFRAGYYQQARTLPVSNGRKTLAAN